MHPALVILLSVLLVQSITLLGKSRLQDILWFLYTSVFHRSTLSSQRSLRRDILSTKRELAATSSQDQFAKWAKLRRKVDKSLADLERTNASLSTARSTFNMLFKGVMFVLTTVLPFVVTSWYSKTPIFWLPPGEHSWFGPLGWFLALPRAPKGAVSSTVWQMVCSRTLIAVVGAVGNLWPGKSEEEVLSKAKVEKVEQELEEKKAAAAAQAGSRTAEAGQARRRTNAAAAEKQDL
ncbi:Golgi to ER traffic protein 1 [Kalmanozyma brasiliensis GHG001]|uniref:Golgi to ER traffic protein 1 n=1 Tax=Kalmanozyma brasiliensis (strain GHG001) TaxID=1365824 RepID=UPI002867FD49|nr:Golgi to ER traffic protein 1 [Kalmanozyma brasiliensis GHG001]KAF6767401.1 Golgi to ER traffic protein 1 [Kalmanozyma brasiliensis GHG001]